MNHKISLKIYYRGRQGMHGEGVHGLGVHGMGVHYVLCAMRQGAQGGIEI